MEGPGGDAVPVEERIVNLAERWGGRGYGAISPKNCFVGGQSTNCKVNNRILQHASAGRRIELWFHSTVNMGAIEQTVISTLSPAWNAQVPW